MTTLDRVKQLCIEHGETLASLERKLDFGNGTLRRWDKSAPTADKLIQVARYFHVDPIYLFCGEEQEGAPTPEKTRATYLEIVSRDREDISPEDEALIKGIIDGAFKGKYKVNLVGGNDESNS